ncbi:hypothetical protein GCM10010307_39190 [Streptomyces vastus]|uniref:Uncharacterized protein n=1 Tax=Streptomyces vastus TaxID=285451 RepID=A0ABP6DGX7_9ACTN
MGFESFSVCMVVLRRTGESGSVTFVASVACLVSTGTETRAGTENSVPESESVPALTCAGTDATK